MLMVLPQYKETSEAQIARQCSIVKFAQTISEEPIVLKQVLNEQVAQREIQVMHALRDIVHIPRLLDVIDSQDGQKILVMPRYNALPPKKHDLLTISKYLSQLAKILEQVHQRGYIHMDLTPSNLMLNKEDELVLIDWGLCRDADSDESHIAGTSGYVSPEVMNGDKITTAADIYSAGIVFGQWLEVYIPDCGLNYLGSKLVRQSTTTYISKKIDDHLQNQRQKMEPEWPLIIAHAADLLKSMIRAQPEQRITAEGILRHPFITSDPSVFQGQEYESVHRLHLRRTLGGKARANREPIFIYRVMSQDIKGNVLVFLESLPKKMLDQLYQQPSTCLAIFKLLKPLSKQIVVRLLYGTGITKPQFDNWFYNPKDADAQEHLNLLWKLNICVENEIVLNKIFQLGLHYALTGSGTQSFGVLIEAEDAMTVAELDRYAQDQWQGVLYSLVGNPSKQRPHSIVELLQRSGLMVPVGRKSEDPDLKITSKGFQFLLQQTSIQIWAFLLHYLEMAEQLDMNVVQVLGFIFQLANLELGKAYSVEALDPSHRMMLEDLKHLGLIYQRKKKSNYFYPTRLSTSLTADTTSVNASGKGYILVETNYRIYAYTNSPFQIAILGLFVSMKTRFPNMVVGLLNRDSVKEAFDNGITADQIISYLTSHAHPQMLQSTPILPSTVVDQIRLWEMERNRLKASPGYLYMNFDNRQQYTDLLKYSTDFGYCLWSSDQKMMLFVSKEGHEPIKQYYSSQNKK